MDRNTTKQGEPRGADFVPSDRYGVRGAKSGQRCDDSPAGSGRRAFQESDMSELPALPSRNSKCPCGSGRKYKRCCYAKDAAAANTIQAKLGRSTASLPNGTMGIPGEESYLTITYFGSEHPEPNPAGGVGEYEIVLLLRRPDAPIEPAQNFSFETTEHNGTSLVGIAYPAVTFVEARMNQSGAVMEVNLHVMTADGATLVARGYPNADGFLSDVRIVIVADSFVEAGKKARLLFEPCLSAIAVAHDVPLIVSHTIIREKATEVIQRAVELPFPAAALSLGGHAQTPEARALFNRYRDALNSTDPNWRFLCYASIVEQLWKHQKALAKAGEPSVDLESICVPETDAEAAAWVRDALAAHYELADQVASDAIPTEARGLTTNDVIVQFVRPLRTAIAHSLLEDGTLPNDQNDVEHMMRVRRFLPMLRCITRLHLRAVYGLPPAMPPKAQS